jgi:hypothetical protein
MSRVFRDLYEAKVKGAIPANEQERDLFRLKTMEENAEVLEKLKSLAEVIANQTKGGARRKTGGDAKLAAEAMKNHNGDIKLARWDFMSTVMGQDNIEKKRARERFTVALKSLKT